jgi:hypothetical protein
MIERSLREPLGQLDCLTQNDRLRRLGPRAEFERSDLEDQTIDDGESLERPTNEVLGDRLLQQCAIASDSFDDLACQRGGIDDLGSEHFERRHPLDHGLVQQVQRTFTSIGELPTGPPVGHQDQTRVM